MADDIASVGIKIETRDIDRANVSLDTLAGKGASVDKSLGQIEGAAARAGKSLDTLGQGAKTVNMDGLANSATKSADGIKEIGNAADRASGGLKAWAMNMLGVGNAAKQAAVEQDRLMGFLRDVYTSGTAQEQKYIKALADRVNQMRLSGAEQERYIARSKGMSNAAQELAGSLRTQLDAARDAAKSSEGLAGTFGMVRAGVTALVGSQLVRWAKDAGGALFEASVNAERLRTMLNFSTGNSARDIEYLRGITQKLGLEMQSTATAYGQFAAAAKGTTLEGQKTRDVFESIAKASAVMGLSAGQTSGVLLALQQMVSKGTVQAEELRGQLGERLPGAFQVAARAMGVTTGELGKMLEQGQVVADDFLPRFARALNDLAPTPI